MPNYQMHGQVLPSNSNLTLPPFNGGWNLDQHDLKISFTVKITNAKIVADVDINRLGEVENRHAHTAVHQIVEAALSTITYERGALLSFAMETAILPDGTVKPIVMFLRELQQLCTAYPPGQLPLNYISSGRMRWVLRDLANALQPDMTTINCARAMEGIRNEIAPPELKEKPAWALMREKLQIDRPYLKSITDSSKDHRHANFVTMELSEMIVILRRSWTVMDRYFHFFKRGGSDALPLEEFPNLQA
jgi:hypothetical protein